MEKLTNSKALEMAITTLSADENMEEVVAKLEKIKASVDKKNSTTGVRKPTATQTENENYKIAILDFLDDGKAYTIGELIKGCSDLTDLTNQRVSAIVRQMVASGSVKREEIKRKAYFSIA